ncbi:unnamed protein product [Cylicocyclus nassatus]|uniref:Uncharacterized protein n=1 Tax=Cylicocyclus nassatus TaxID=53992 RepID=A0AA36ME91_CYLNA|nr:unnamed protein product [Cylicocyclus nassatus]
MVLSIHADAQARLIVVSTMWIWKGFILAALFAVVSSKRHLITDEERRKLTWICEYEKDEQGRRICVHADTECSSCKTMKDERKKKVCLGVCDNQIKYIDDETMH